MADRKRSNEEIDVLNQFLSEGEAPLPYEAEDNNDNDNSEAIETTEEVIAPVAELKDENKEGEVIEGEENVDAAKEIIAAKEEKAPVAEVELTDEAVLAYLKNKKGKEISSLDEFINPAKELTEDEKKEAQEKRESNMFAHGLTNGLFTKKQLDNFISDSKNPADLVYEAYAADQKKSDDTLTDADIREEFDEKFGLNIDDKENRLYIAGQNLLNRMADGLLKQRYPKIVNLENEYSSFESNQKVQNEESAKIAKNIPAYKKDVEEIKASTKKINIPISDTENFEYVVDDKVLDEVMGEMLSENVSKENIAKGWTKDNLNQVNRLAVIMKSLPDLMEKYADKRELAKQAGLRGIVPKGKEGSRTKLEVKLTDDQKAAIAMIDERLSLAN